MRLQLDQDELRILTKGLRADSLETPTQLSWEPAPTRSAPASGEIFRKWAAELPDRASWSPEGKDPEMVARDAFLLSALLSGWKVFRLIEGFLKNWETGPYGFDGLNAAIVLRAAMEEAARVTLAGRGLHDELNSWNVATSAAMPAALIGLSNRLLSFDETTGLERPSNDRWKALQSVKKAVPDGPFYRGGPEGADYLYGRLSTYVHPKGVADPSFAIRISWESRD